MRRRRIRFRGAGLLLLTVAGGAAWGTSTDGLPVVPEPACRGSESTYDRKRNSANPPKIAIVEILKVGGSIPHRPDDEQPDNRAYRSSGKSSAAGTRTVRAMNNPIIEVSGKWVDRTDFAARKCAPVVRMSSTTAMVSGAGSVNVSSIR